MASVNTSVMVNTVLSVPLSVLSCAAGGSSLQSRSPGSLVSYGFQLGLAGRQWQVVGGQGRGEARGLLTLFWWSFGQGPKFLGGLGSPGWLWFPVLLSQVASLSSMGLCLPDQT